MPRKIITVGTRGSPLALWQAGWVKAQLAEGPNEFEVVLKRIKTSGDKITDVPLARVGGKGLFVKEIEEALLRREIDLAVHSMKDVPTFFPEGLHLAAITKRGDPRDALISRKNIPLNQLSKKAWIGTCSLRRQSQLLHYCPTFQISQIRGNLDTRIRKLRDSDNPPLDAIILAAAGLRRMGWENQVTEYLSVEISLPAIGQGAIGIECREDDSWIGDLLKPLADLETGQCVSGERGLLKRLEGGCQVPIAAYGQIQNGILKLRGLVASVDGKRIVRDEIEGDPNDSENLGNQLAERLLGMGAGKILEEITGAAI